MSEFLEKVNDVRVEFIKNYKTIPLNLITGEDSGKDIKYALEGYLYPIYDISDNETEKV